MSAIYGIARYDSAPVDRETLRPMAFALAHWGKDGHGQWCGPGAGLGQMMLHVTPESLHERQPAGIRAAPHLIITADARIDNRDELFDALGVPVPGREQTPDSSLILLAYERWGADCPTRLLGDFAFAIWNGRDRTLFCARDPFGCRPFVYHYGGQRFLFASDVKGVLAAMESPRLNEPLIAAYLQFATYFAEKRLTFFEEVVKLPPAHTLTLTAKGLQLSPYWSPENAPEVRLSRDNDYAERMAFLFRQAVECRLRSAFPVGTHLSGGLDSSAVSIVAARLERDRGRELAALSWSPRVTSFEPGSEHARIDAICRQEGLICEYLPATVRSLTETFRLDFTVEPVSMMAREANVQATAEARGIRVLLSGWGGDEAATFRSGSTLSGLFAGDSAAFQAAVSQRVANAGVFRKMRSLAGVARDVVVPRLPDSLYSLTANAFLMHRAPCIQSTFAQQYRREADDLRGPVWRNLPELRATICRRLETGHIPMRLEHWAGSGASHGLVYRYPMLDKRLVEFALGVPAGQLYRPGLKQTLLQRAIADLLPPEWNATKAEPGTMAALKGEYFRAHSEWAAHIQTKMAASPATRFVDPKKIQEAVQLRTDSERIVSLSGVREAFGCYAIGTNIKR